MEPGRPIRRDGRRTETGGAECSGRLRDSSGACGILSIWCRLHNACVEKNHHVLFEYSDNKSLMKPVDCMRIARTAVLLIQRSRERMIFLLFYFVSSMFPEVSRVVYTS